MKRFGVIGIWYVVDEEGDQVFAFPTKEAAQEAADKMNKMKMDDPADEEKEDE